MLILKVRVLYKSRSCINDAPYLLYDIGLFKTVTTNLNHNDVL